MSAPFRTEPRGIDPHLLQQSNVGYAGARKCEPASKAMARIKGARSACRERIDSWVWHPDERVVIAYLGKWGCVIMAQKANAYHVHADLIRRAQRDAELEGLHWTPVLDALAMSAFYPTGSRPAPAEDRFTGRVGDLAPWITAQEDPAELDRLLAFRFPPVRHGLFGLGRCLSDHAFGAALSGTQAERRALASNPHHSAHAVARIAKAALDSVDGTNGTVREFQDVMRALEAAGHAIPAWVANELSQRAASPEQSPSLKRANALALLSLTTISPAQIREVFDTRYHSLMPAIARHPATPVDILRSMARGDTQDFLAHDVQSSIGGNPAALRDAEIRALFLQRGREYDLIALLETAPAADEFRLVFRRLCWYYVGAGGAYHHGWDRALEKIHDGDLAVICAEDWHPLLTLVQDEPEEVHRMTDLVRVPSFREDPVVRAALIERGGMRALDKLARHPAPNDGRQLFERIMQRSPTLALSLIEQRAEISRHIQPADLAPLLKDSDSQMRQRAILATGALRRPDRPERQQLTTETPSRPSGR
jgi:hypothetical protein